MGPNATRSPAVPDGAASDDFAATVVSLPPTGGDPRLFVPDSGIDSQPMSGLDSLPMVFHGTDSAPTSAADEPGLGHIGRYELQRTLGTGGLGTVYEARDPVLSRTVAVKTLQIDVVPGSQAALDRLFLNEARAAAALSHAYIVTVFDAGLSPQGVYIAMERLRGHDMRRALDAGWRPSPVQAVLLARRVADALAYAHARGVVHCDIKPANIFLSRSGKPKLLDFGIARIVRRVPDATHASEAAETDDGDLRNAAPADGLVAGSPHYLAPEQLRGEAVDGRTDVYALAVVLYELLTRRKAFVGESIAQIHAAVLGHTPPRADIVDPALPAGLAELIAQAMSRDPAQRPVGAAEFAQALRPWHETPGKATAPRPAPVATPPREVDVPAISNVATSRPAATWRWMAVAVGALAAAGLATVALTLDSGRGAVQPRPAVVPATPEGANAVPPAGAPVASTGRVQLAIDPQGEVEVDGNPAGLAAPSTTLELDPGPHLIIVRHPGQPAFITEVDVRAGETVSIAHRFGR